MMDSKGRTALALPLEESMMNEWRQIVRIRGFRGVSVKSEAIRGRRGC